MSNPPRRLLRKAMKLSMMDTAVIGIHRGARAAGEPLTKKAIRKRLKKVRKP